MLKRAYGARQRTKRTDLSRWSTVRSGAAASRSRASSSAAATSAVSVPRTALFGAGETEGEAHAIMDAAWEAGITTFDTADAYGGGRSESFIGSWLRTKGADVRDRIVLTTKTFNPMSEGADHGLRRADPAPARRAWSASASSRSRST